MSDKNTTATRPVPAVRKRRSLTWLLWFLFAAISLLLFSLLGVLGGYQSGRAEHERWLGEAAGQNLQAQWELGLQDLQAGSFDRARQRFEYIIQRNPNFPGVQDKLVEVLAILNATATPTPPPPSVTPTPTRDLRPVEDLFRQAGNVFASGDWNTTIDTLVSVREADPQYRVAEVDGLLYLALRNRGVDKIQAQSNLEGGIYDLALAERFGPLDAQASGARELARLYVIGLSFWEVYPEQAVYYFGQVASAAPYLQDGSGWTAQARYAAALGQYGDQLARDGDWCAAQQQYELAVQASSGAAVQPTAVYAAQQCNPPTATATDTTPTLTLTATGIVGPTATASLFPPTAGIVSPTPSQTASQPVPSPLTPQPPNETPTPTPTPTPTQPSGPADTPTLEPSPTETPPPTETRGAPAADRPLPSETGAPPPEAATAPTQEAGSGPTDTPEP